MTHIKTIYGLFGIGGQSREVAPLLKRNQPNSDIYLVDKGTPEFKLDGYKCVSETEFAAFSSDEKYFNVAVSNPTIRKRIVSQCMGLGFKPMAIVSDDLIQYDGNSIGEGAIICDRTMITCNVEIGSFFICNYYSYIAHDCKIGDFVTFLPNVNCSGNVHIGDRVLVGAGAIIKNGFSEQPLIIGEGAFIGMGAVVTKDVAPNSIMIGNPARPLEK